ncbi:CHAT domain-containing protein [Streptomyces sp. NPDC002685]|uniref:CHAT domain-containing protein n=1 Tax=Streptomyces sp. NPDC002685 TaxID=3154540 RepID=UPI00331BE00C
MNHVVEIMVLPSNVDSDQTLAQFYILQHESWHDVPFSQLPTIGLEKLRPALEALLGQIGERLRVGSAVGAEGRLRTRGEGYWNNLLPPRIRSALTRALEQGDGPPQLLLHTHQALEWIPWELLHDGREWLGVSCQISRLPMVVGGPAGNGAPHQVQHAHSFLGSEVFDDVDCDEYRQWSSTFNCLGAAGGTVHLLPKDGLEEFPTIDNLEEMQEADIVHFTCHGGTDRNGGGPCLQLNPYDTLTGDIDTATVEAMVFGSPGPLVFGNACSSAAVAPDADVGPPLTRGLGMVFFNRGASAFIGSIAPVSKATAVGFAGTFYQHLLGDGLPVGEALRLTKREAKGGSDPSWLFYCLYGSPRSRFLPPGPADPS